MMPVSFSFTPKRADYVTATRAYLMRQPLTLVLVLGLAFILALLWVFALIGGNLQASLVYLIPALVIPPVLIALYLIVMPMIVASQVTKRTSMMAAMQWRASESGLHVLNAKVEVETLLNWGLFRHLAETKNYFLLIFHDPRRMYQLVPKRAFASEQDVDRFRQLAQQLTHGS